MSKSKPKHTPGPWRLNKYQSINAWLIQGPERVTQKIAEVSEQTDCDINKANMALIAAAPEMLEALEDMVAVHSLANVDPADLNPNTETEEGLALIKARAAIKKAKGE